jgi:hypothetical protein
MKQAKITFSASGTVTQSITFLNDEVSAQDLQKGLNNGEYITTIQEENTYVETISGERVASIDNVDNELTYEDYTVEED